MLVIRHEQMRVFEANAFTAFEDRTFAHLQRYFPRHCALLGERQMRLVVRHGAGKAAVHHLTAESCVRSYIDLMCLLGSGFDADPLMPWALDILRAHSAQPADQVRLGDRLYHRAWDYVGHIVADYRDEKGAPSTARFVPELRQLWQLGRDKVTPAELPGFLRSLGERVTRVLPAKSGHVGEPTVSAALALGAWAAREHGIASKRGTSAYVVMRFILGAEFDRDPLLPWASAVLNDTSVVDPDARADRLFSEAVRFLKRWWDSAPAAEH